MATEQIERLHSKLRQADLALVSGDLTNFGGRREAAQVIGTIQEVCSDILAVPGNLDRPEVLEFLSEEAICLHGSGHKRGAVALFGCGGSNHTPFHTPFELGEDEIGQLLRQGWKEVQAQEPLVMLCHTPPYGTGIDRLRDGRHVGSPMVRRVIEELRPQVCISGHVHEAAGVASLGSTTLVNAGPLRAGGYIVVEWHDAAPLMVELRKL